MPSSPFKRRPTLSKTYGKRPSSTSASASPAPARSTATRPDKSALAALLADSSDEGSDEAVEAQLIGRRVDDGGTKDKGKARAVQRRDECATDKAETAQDGGKPTRGVKAVGASVVSSLAGKRRSSTRGAGPAAGPDEATAVDSTVWDEPTAISSRPQAPPPATRTRSSRRQSTAAAAEPSQLEELKTASPPKRTRISRSPTKAAPALAAEDEPLSDPPSPPPRRKRARRSVEPNTSAQSKRAGPSLDKKDDDDVPPPFDYVPLKARLRSSPSKASSPVPSPPKPHPPSRPTSSTMSRSLSSSPRSAALPTIQTTHPSSSSPARPRTPNRIGSATLPARPVSPAKDLAALFSRFSGSRAEKDKDASGDESSGSLSVGLKRTTSAGGGGVVAALGARKGAGERAEEDRNSRAGTPASPSRPTRIAFDRSISQPIIPTSPLSPHPSSPAAGSPFRRALDGTTSFPSISPLPFTTTGSRSPSPHKPAQSLPALGTAYRPVSFGLGANGAESRTRTYGGARSFRRDVAEEALLAHPAAASSSRALPSNLNLSSSPRLPSLPPSVSHRIPGPSAPRETYSQLREKWGVAAEEELDEDEASQSTERGAKVVGTGILRAQGEGKRWGDEMGWVLEGLREGKGGSGARSSAIELLGKTLDREWMRRLKSSGMAEQVYLAFRRGGAGEGDRVLDVALVLLVALLFRDQRLSEPLFRLSPSDLASPTPSPQRDQPSTSSSPRKAEYEEIERECDLLKVFEGLLRREWAGEEIGTSKGEGQGKKGGAEKGKMAKSDARHLQSLRDIIDQSELFTDSALPITLRTLVLQTFRTASFFSPRPIFQPQQLLCTSGAFQATVEVFVDECKALEQRLQKYQSGMDLVPPPGTSSSVSLPTLNLCLAIFESTSLATPYAFHVISSPAYLSPLGRSLANLVLVTFILAFNTSGSAADKQSATALLLSALGILFGLTTESAWSECLIQPVGVQGDDDGFVGTLIRIVLACRRASVATARNQRPKSGDRERIKHVGEVELDEDGEEEDGEPVDKADHQEWDVLCLALGVLANLVESVEDVKDVLRDLHLSPTCPPSRRCTHHCLCPAPPSRPALTALAQLYLDPLADAPNSVYQTSVAGFVRLVLGLALVDNPRNERLVLDALADADADAEMAPLQAILEALDEFARLHDEQHEVQHGLLRQLEGGTAPRESSQRTQAEELDDNDGDGDGMDVEELVAQRPTAAGAATSDVAKRIRETVVRLRSRVRTTRGF